MGSITHSEPTDDSQDKKEEESAKPLYQIISEDDQALHEMIARFHKASEELAGDNKIKAEFIYKRLDDAHSMVHDLAFELNKQNNNHN